jgi:hypothetical protein
MTNEKAQVKTMPNYKAQMTSKGQMADKAQMTKSK